MRFSAVTFAFIALTSPVLAQSLSGQADVIDVDTIAIRGEKTRLRLYGIDGPESQQTCNDASGTRYLCGSKAADALASIIGRNGRVNCKEQDRDRYGRIVATCDANGRDIGGELIRQGWAVEYTQYSDGRYSERGGRSPGGPSAVCGQVPSSSRGTGAVAKGCPTRPRLARTASAPSRVTFRAQSGSTICRAATTTPARPSTKSRASAGSALRTTQRPPDGGRQEGRGRIQCLDHLSLGSCWQEANLDPLSPSINLARRLLSTDWRA